MEQSLPDAPKALLHIMLRKLQDDILSPNFTVFDDLANFVMGGFCPTL